MGIKGLTVHCSDHKSEGVTLRCHVASSVSIPTEAQSIVPSFYHIPTMHVLKQKLCKHVGVCLTAKC